MKGNVKKLITSIVLAVIMIFTILPTVQAIYRNDTVRSELKSNTNNNIISENKKQMNTEENYSDFQIVLAGVLNEKNADEMLLKDVSTILLNKPNKNGIWVEEESRDYILNLVNTFSNKIYEIDEDGFLVENKNFIKEEVNQEFEIYTNKIDKMISEEKLIVITISDTYKNLNKIDNDIINIGIEDTEYGLQFKDNEEKERNKEDLLIFNKKHYSTDNREQNEKYLMEKIIETYYHDSKDQDIEKDNSNNVTNEDRTDVTEDNNKDNNKENNITNEIPKSDTTLSGVIEHHEQENIFDDKVSKEDFNLILAGILSDDVNVDNINEILKEKPIKAGIWINKNVSAAFLKFINEHTIYTYSIADDGYLTCNNVMKDNPNLDILEKSETEFDIEYKKILTEDKMIMVNITNKFLQYNENNDIVIKNLANDEYKKTFSYEEKRIILLNSVFYSNAGYDLALSDHLVKAIENVQEKVITGELNFNKQPLTRSDTSKPGNMFSGQNVYAGPDSSNYFKVGSVDAGEKVYLLGQCAGWYHIQYMVTGTSQQKSGFVPVATVNNHGYSVHEEQMTGGQRYPQQGLEVMSCDDSAIYVKVGSVYQGEGVTQLYEYTYSDGGKSYRISYIEFSTASGTKRGYVYTNQLNNASYPTSIARVIDTNSAYAGPDSSFVKLGGAYYNEYVTILAKNTNFDWVFVEYNTTNGRKRGYMSYAKLSNCNHPGNYNDLATNQGLRQATQSLTVYGGPNNNNANIGSVFNQEVVSLYGIENGYAYIEYSTTSGAKRGYIIENALTGTTPPTLPNLPTYANFTSGTYGTSGLGQSLKYYKIGNGSNVAFAVFAQHGWEDAWAYDGIELVNIANRLMSNLSSSGISNNWTLYVIPYANPDGITNGYTNNGPGRCTVSTGIDMNRCWPANFKPYYTSRNYTGDSALGATEASNLKNFISNTMGNGEKIILDIHGWLNQTYGDASIAQYFGNQFGFGHSSTYGSGYLETWGKSIGAKSCLVEFPMPSSEVDILNRDFSGKLTNAIKEMLNKTGSSQGEGGTAVNESVKVISDGNLNVRSGPGTTYSIIASIAKESIVTRIRKSVAIANGYTWDKIRLSNGTEGYVATNYLENVSNDEFTYDEKTFVKNKTFSSHDNAYESDKTSQDALWNTMSVDERTSKNNEMTSNYNRLTQAAKDFRNYYDLGSEALDYFLKNEGGTHNIGDLRTLFIIPSQAEVEYLYLNRNMKAAEHFTTNQTSSFALNYEYDLKVGDLNLEMIDILLAAQAGDYLSSVKVDWFIAAHSFKMGNYSTVEKNGSSYKMYTNFNMSDYYDWDDAMVPFPINQNLIDPNSYIQERHIRDLHVAGRAKNFESKGTIRICVEWQTGQTAQQAKVSML